MDTMLKRLLSLAIALVMVIGLMPWNAESVYATSEETNPSEPVATSTLHTCANCADAEPWGDDDAEVNKLPTTSGSYYLVNDVILSGKDQVVLGSVDIAICLNGKTIDGRGLNDGLSIFKMTADANGAGANLTITDCNATVGTVIPNPNADGGVAIYAKATGQTSNSRVIMYNVVIDGQSAANTKKGGAFYSGTGIASVILTDVDIRNCYATEGGAIRFYDGYVNLTNVDITNCHATNGTGGAIYMDKANGQLTNVNISGCTATGDGGAAMRIKAGVVSMSGGEITEAADATTYLVLVAGTFNISGDAKITDNGDDAVDVFYTDTGKGTISGGTFSCDFRVPATRENVTVSGGNFAEGAYFTNTPLITGGNFAYDITSKLTGDYVWYEATGNVALKNHNHVFKNGSCTVCGEADPNDAPEVELFDIQSSSIVLGNELAMYFFVNKADLDGEDYIAYVTKTYADGRNDVTVEIPYSGWESRDDGRMRFKFDGIAAKEMGDDISVVIKNAEGTVLSNTYVDSIQKYVERGLSSGKATGELATMLVDMLNYGAAAQGIFGYNEENLANANMDAYQNLATQSVALNNNQEKGNGFKSMSLVLESNISMIMFFDKAVVDQSMTAVVTFTDHYGKDHTIEVAGSNFEDRLDKGWAIIINELVVADGCQLVKCEFKDANGNMIEGIYGIDSMESMCARAVAGGGGSYYEDIMKFSISAYNYFH